MGEAEDSPLLEGLLGSFSNYRDFMGLKEPGWGPFHISQASVAALGSLAWTPDAEPHGCQLRPLGGGCLSNAPCQVGKTESVGNWEKWENLRMWPSW